MNSSKKEGTAGFGGPRQKKRATRKIQLKFLAHVASSERWKNPTCGPDVYFTHNARVSTITNFHSRGGAHETPGAQYIKSLQFLLCGTWRGIIQFVSNHGKQTDTLNHHDRQAVKNTCYPRVPVTPSMDNNSSLFLDPQNPSSFW